MCYLQEGNNCKTSVACSLSIRPSEGARGEEILPDTQANYKWPVNWKRHHSETNTLLLNKT